MKSVLYVRYLLRKISLTKLILNPLVIDNTCKGDNSSQIDTVQKIQTLTQTLQHNFGYDMEHIYALKYSWHIIKIKNPRKQLNQSQILISAQNCVVEMVMY